MMQKVRRKEENMAERYVYAVARIRSLENSLLTDAEIGQLLACRTFDSAKELLAGKGWSSEEASHPQTGRQDVSRRQGQPEQNKETGQRRQAGQNESPEERMLRRETEKLWETARDLQMDPSVLEALTLRSCYQNLKTAVRALYAGSPDMVRAGMGQGVSGGLTAEKLYGILREKRYSTLPEHMRGAAKEAPEALFRTGDGQLSDTIVDRALLDAAEDMGSRSREEALRLWSKEFVAGANIRIAFRAARAGKDRRFLNRALAPCRGINVAGLCAAALSGAEEVCGFLGQEGYGEAAEALQESDTAFERWCDNRVMQAIRPQRYQAFSAGPLVVYLLAREHEIRTVRMILNGRRNGLPDSVLRERIRDMYV